MCISLGLSFLLIGRISLARQCKDAATDTNRLKDGGWQRGASIHVGRARAARATLVSVVFTFVTASFRRRFAAALI